MFSPISGEASERTSAASRARAAAASSGVGRYASRRPASGIPSDAVRRKRCAIACSLPAGRYVDATIQASIEGIGLLAKGSDTGCDAQRIGDESLIGTIDQGEVVASVAETAAPGCRVLGDRAEVRDERHFPQHLGALGVGEHGDRAARIRRGNGPHGRSREQSIPDTCDIYHDERWSRTDHRSVTSDSAAAIGTRKENPRTCNREARSARRGARKAASTWRWA